MAVCVEGNGVPRIGGAQGAAKGSVRTPGDRESQLTGTAPGTVGCSWGSCPRTSGRLAFRKKCGFLPGQFLQGGEATQTLWEELRAIPRVHCLSPVGPAGVCQPPGSRACCADPRYAGVAGTQVPALWELSLVGKMRDNTKCNREAEKSPSSEQSTRYV